MLKNVEFGSNFVGLAVFLSIKNFCLKNGVKKDREKMNVSEFSIYLKPTPRFGPAFIYFTFLVEFNFVIDPKRTTILF